MPFQPGQSGNPHGRPPGTASRLVPRATQAKIMHALVGRALQGDVAAAEVVLSVAATSATVADLAHRVRKLESGHGT